jgi:uncharacterized protein (TIGR02246 family)
MKMAALLFLMLAAGGSQAQVVPSAADSAAISAALDRWFDAWEKRDATLGARDYRSDASWTNAFGMTRRGRVAIEATLREVFALPFVTAGESRPTAQDIRWLRPDVALVITSVERAGQNAPDGTPLGTRRTTHHRVFTKGPDGWRIASHLISDARDQRRAAH